MEVLEDERKGSFAEIGLARFADGARRRIRPERFVIRAAVVVAGEAEEAGDPEDEKCGREWQESGVPAGFGTEQRVGRIAEDLRRVKGREIGAESVVRVLECGPVGVDEEAPKPRKTSSGESHQLSVRDVWPNPRLALQTMSGFAEGTAVFTSVAMQSTPPGGMECTISGTCGRLVR